MDNFIDRYFRLTCSVLAFGLALIPVDGVFAQQKPVTTVLFGSCIKQDQPLPIFNQFGRLDPDLFIFLGDNIYADTDDMQVMRQKYAKLAAKPGFEALRKQCPILATWDDHDYGKNDAGADYSQKAASQKIFLDFWKEPQGTSRRNTPGIYDSKIYGPQGKRLQVILLDTRFFRGPLKTGKRRTGGPYYPSKDQSATMLGERQWKWLEDELKKPAEVRIVASSIQLISGSDGQETWSNLPHERARFFNLIRQTKANGVVIISGDRHWAELSAVSTNVPYKLYDLTSSSLNQPHPRGTPTINRFRDLKQTYHRENFGQIKIDWNSAQPLLFLQIHDIDGKLRLGRKIKLADLNTHLN